MGALSSFLVALFTPGRRWSYRRLLAFAVATALLLAGQLSEGAWTTIALAFIGGESVVRAVAAGRGGGA